MRREKRRKNYSRHAINPNSITYTLEVHNYGYIPDIYYKVCYTS
jgi:hypothetical protein